LKHCWRWRIPEIGMETSKLQSVAIQIDSKQKVSPTPGPEKCEIPLKLKSLVNLCKSIFISFIKPETKKNRNSSYPSQELVTKYLAISLSCHNLLPSHLPKILPSPHASWAVGVAVHAVTPEAQMCPTRSSDWSKLTNFSWNLLHPMKFNIEP